MVNLNNIWDDQLEFNAKLVDIEEIKKDTDEFRKWNNFYTLALSREVGEVLDTTDWKIHRKENKPVIPSNTLEELVDCMKYWMSLCQLHGFSAEEVEEEYYRKSHVVVQRHKQEIIDVIRASNDKIVGVDIDGVLADYPRSFVDFINDELGTNYDISQVDSYDIYGCLGIPKAQGIELKDKYRQSGQKRYIPVCNGAKAMLQGLRDRGYKIMLLTARPYQEYKRMFADTMEWLETNELPYDSIIFDDKKEERLLREFGKDRIEFFIEDYASNANKISDLGVPCYLISRPYNTKKKLAAGVKRVQKLEEIND